MAQRTLTHAAQINALREYGATVRAEAGELAIAAQRVRVCKTGRDRSGVLEFGTEVITTDEGWLAALLVASRRVATCFDLGVDRAVVLHRCRAAMLACLARATRSYNTFGSAADRRGQRPLSIRPQSIRQRAGTRTILHLRQLIFASIKRGDQRVAGPA